MSHKHKLLSLSVALILAVSGCTSASDQIAQNAAATAQRHSDGTASKPDGAAVFRKFCVTCHGADGKLGLNGAKDLSQSILTQHERVQMVTKGKGLMTPFQEILSPEEIQAVAEFTMTLKK